MRTGLPTGPPVSPAEARPGGGRLKDQAHQQIVIVLASATLHYRGAIDSGGVALSWHVAGTGLRRHSRHLGKRCPNPDMWEVMVNAPAAVFVRRHRDPSGYHDEVFHDDDHVVRA